MPEQPILELFDLAYGGPFLFAIKRSSKTKYNNYCDAYVGYYQGEVGVIVLSNSRSVVVWECDEDVQYYYVQGSEYENRGRVRTWSSLSNARMDRDFWYRWCREFGLYPAEDIEEQLLAAEVREEN